MPSAPSDRINAVADLARVMQEFSGARRLLFRGQNVDEPLLPRIVRIAQKKGISRIDLEQIERRMLERFRKESMPFVRGLAATTSWWEWLSVAQHQGLPTRLLDWTANALAGVWFAVSSDPKAGDNGVLWVLDVPQEYERSPTVDVDPFTFKQTFVFQPFHLDQRIVSQAGWFTAHKFSDKSNQFLPLTKIGQFKRRIRKFNIAAERFAFLRKELRLMGVTQAAMFPDLSGLCADIQADCVDSWRSPGTI
jgi:hypothetical protein